MGSAGTPRLTPKNKPPPIHEWMKTLFQTTRAHKTQHIKHAKFGSSASKGVCINRRTPPQKKKECWGHADLWCVDDHLEIRPSPASVILPKLVVLGQAVRALILLRRSAWKKSAPRVPPFKVTQCHRNRHGSIRHPWLPILLTFHSKRGPISYRFRDKTEISV